MRNCLRSLVLSGALHFEHFKPHVDWISLKREWEKFAQQKEVKKLKERFQNVRKILYYPLFQDEFFFWISSWNLYFTFELYFLLKFKSGYPKMINKRDSKSELFSNTFQEWKGTIQSLSLERQKNDWLLLRL